MYKFESLSIRIPFKELTSKGFKCDWKESITYEDIEELKRILEIPEKYDTLQYFETSSLDEDCIDIGFTSGFILEEWS